mmetsp:Transcript_64619/g.210744  ORF Transcript_64619/g.210744 Transcript_64619/m.210744 type:complete len:331 (-) Transcript_64619:2003-2995(-)
MRILVATTLLPFRISAPAFSRLLPVAVSRKFPISCFTCIPSLSTGGRALLRKCSEKASNHRGAAPPLSATMSVATRDSRSRFRFRLTMTSWMGAAPRPGMKCSCSTKTSMGCCWCGNTVGMNVRKSVVEEPSGSNSWTCKPTFKLNAARVDPTSKAQYIAKMARRTHKQDMHLTSVFVSGWPAEANQLRSQHDAFREATQHGAMAERLSTRRFSSMATTATKKVIWNAKSKTMPTLAYVQKLLKPGSGVNEPRANARALVADDRRMDVPQPPMASPIRPSTSPMSEGLPSTALPLGLAASSRSSSAVTIMKASSTPTPMSTKSAMFTVSL